MPVSIHGRQYATVAERLDAAHAGARPAGITNIATEFLPVGDVVLCRATVTFEGGHSFVGHAEVPVNSSQPAERDAPYECAETSAWGRALAAAGYPGNEDGLAGAEEVRRPPRRENGHAAREFSQTPEGRETAKESPRAWYERFAPVAEGHGFKRVTFTEDAPDEFVVAECKKLRAFLQAVKTTAERK